MTAHDHIDSALTRLEQAHDQLDSDRRVVLENAIALLRSLRGTIDAGSHDWLLKEAA